MIGNIAGKSEDEFVAMAKRVHESGQGLAALELNLSCPNVSGGLDFATSPDLTGRIVRRCRDACPDLPLIAKLTPNVTDITAIAKACADAGADAVSAVNTFVGMAVVAAMMLALALSLQAPGSKQALEAKATG